MSGLLPFLLTVPHGGNVIPAMLKPYCSLSTRDLFDDSDAFTNEIYNLDKTVKKILIFPYYRACIDVSRSPDQIPPHFVDGVIKQKTCYDKTVYKNRLSKKQISMLLKAYYYPFHNDIHNHLKDNTLRFAFDCHTMAEYGPPIAPDRGLKRPMINLGNNYNKSSELRHIKLLSKCFMDCFSLKREEVTINVPFAGGYITRNYGKLHVPWIQIELNRSYYLQAAYFSSKTLEVNPERIMEIQKMLICVFKAFYKRL